MKTLTINQIDDFEIPELFRFQLPAGNVLTDRGKGAIFLIIQTPLDMVRERLESDVTFPLDDIDEAISEFKKFLILILLHPGGMAMVSPVVDEVWHEFILFTEEYSRFCHSIFGYFLHHRPNTKSSPGNPESVNKFVRAYRDAFGEIPKIWRGPTTECGGTTNCQEEDENGDTTQWDNRFQLLGECAAEAECDSTDLCDGAEYPCSSVRLPATVAIMS